MQLSSWRYLFYNLRVTKKVFYPWGTKFAHRWITVTLILTLLMTGCQIFQSGRVLQATVIYRNLQGEPRVALIGLDRVLSERRVKLGEEIQLEKTDRSLVSLSYWSDGIYAESRAGDAVRLVKGKNLTDPVLSITSEPNTYVLSYIAMQGRRPVLKLRTIVNGHINKTGFVVPLSEAVDNYDISDFSMKEAP